MRTIRLILGFLALDGFTREEKREFWASAAITLAACLLFYFYILIFH